MLSQLKTKNNNALSVIVETLSQMIWLYFYDIYLLADYGYKLGTQFFKMNFFKIKVTSKHQKEIKNRKI